MDNASQDAPPPASQQTLVGKSIGKYDILRQVGRGGMGAVYEALNTTIKKRVAMKCIDSSLARNEEANARFQREALAASAIESPHIVQIFDAGATEEGMPYIVMEMLRGRDLGRCLAEVGRLDVTDSLMIIAQVLKGLHHAHTAGIIHRDLKPDNVFLVEREDEPYAVKILDFGVSKISRSEDVPLKTLTQQGSVVGTPFYMAPEQAQAYPDVDARADIYSAGAILYECLTGKPPHSGQSYEQVIVNICMKDAPDIRTHNPSVPDSLAQVIAKALSRERDGRYRSARELLDALMDHAPAELRAKYHSAASGLRRVSIRTSARAEVDEEAKTIERDQKPATGSPAAQGALADTVRADSGMMSVAAPPSEPPALPLDRARRRWTMAVVGGAVVVVAVGALVMTSLGEPETGPAVSSEQDTTAATAEPAAGGAAATSADPTASDEQTQAPAEADASTAATAPAPPPSPRAPPRPRPPKPRPPAAPGKPTPKPAATSLPMVTDDSKQPSGLELLRE